MNALKTFSCPADPQLAAEWKHVMRCGQAFVDAIERYAPDCVNKREAFDRATKAVMVVLRDAGGPCGWQDVVADHAATLALFQAWGPRLMGMGWPVAFVAQDGCDGESVPWEGIRAVFIGGSTAYKLGAAAAHVATMARAMGKWVHMGRVNTARRLHYAAVLGCDSVDGSGWSKWPKSMLERHGDLLRSLSVQRTLILEELGIETKGSR